MDSQIDVLFFLDNPKAVIIEIGQHEFQDPENYIDTLWFIYYKRGREINRFRFISPSGEGQPEDIMEDGVLQRKSAEGNYSIAIGMEILDFNEKPPKMATKSALYKIEKYINQF